eukprot:m.28269 g.28269  ORF g.28269 m.28269 type:complete len:58 (-) comp14106_c0_seq1:2540-2713(-)
MKSVSPTTTFPTSPRYPPPPPLPLKKIRLFVLFGPSSLNETPNDPHSSFSSLLLVLL